MKFFSHHIGDFDKATRHLTRIERSVYRDLMDVYYDTEAPLTLDAPALCRKIIARSTEEAAAVDLILAEFFTRTPTGWYHERCEEELDICRKSTSQKSEAGKASAAARAAKLQAALNSRSTDVETAVEQPLNGCLTTHDPLPNTHHPLPTTQDPIQPQSQTHFDAVPASTPRKRRTKDAKPDSETGPVWAAYANAYWEKYKVPPVRNAMVNGQLSQLVKRLGVQDAEQVATFYLTHRARFYIEKLHPVGLLLADCEKLRTEWATSTQMTSTRATQEDRTQTNFDAFAPLIAEAREREKNASK